MGKDIHTKEVGRMERLAERENIHLQIQLLLRPHWLLKYAMLMKANLKIMR